MPHQIGGRLNLLFKEDQITYDQNGPGDIQEKKHKSIIDTDFKGIQGFM